LTTSTTGRVLGTITTSFLLATGIAGSMDTRDGFVDLDFFFATCVGVFVVGGVGIVSFGF
jgi:hypothetical protein